MYTVHYHEDAVSVDIPKLGGKERKLIKNAIEKKLLEIPEVFGVPLRGSLAGYRKLRVGNHRIVFKIIGDRVNILLIEHRSVAYGKITKRI